jgi:hypothetical protein
LSGHLLNYEGRYPEARAYLDEATRLSESLPAGAGLDRQMAMRGLITLFTMDFRNGDAAAAEASARRFQAAAEAWLREAPSPEARYWSGVAHEVRAHAASLAGDPDLALEVLAQAREVFASLTAEYPHEEAYPRELAVTLMLAAQARTGTGNAGLWKPHVDDWPGAEAALREAEAIFGRRSREDPDDARAAIDWATTLTSLAAVVGRLDPIRSLAQFEEARAVFARLPSVIRDAGYARNQEWFTHCAMAEVLARAGRRDEALAAEAIGLAMVERINRQSEDNLEDRHALHACRFLGARARATLGEADGPARTLDEVARGLGELVATRPGAVTPYLGLVETLSLLAELRPQERCALLEEARTTWRGWPGTPTPFTRKRSAELEAAVAGCARAH